MGGEVKLTDDEIFVLLELQLRPSGAPFRGEELKAAVVSLAAKTLVCDPHTMGKALFTRITPAGLAALSPTKDPTHEQ